MANMLIAIHYALANEGGFVNNFNDKGGPTNYGLSQKFLNGLSTPSNLFKRKWSEEQIKEMTQAQAIEIYQVHLWQAIYSQIESQDICNYYFDMVVNHGEEQATKILQRSLWAADETTIFYENLRDDGILESITMKGIELIINQRAGNIILLTALKATRAQYYRCIAKRPGQEQFLEGWLKRAYK